MSELINKQVEITDEFYWYLSKNRPFVISDEYSIELEHVDVKTGKVKIKVSRNKQEVVCDDQIS